MLDSNCLLSFLSVVREGHSKGIQFDPGGREVGVGEGQRAEIPKRKSYPVKEQYKRLEVNEYSRQRECFV